MVQMAGICNLGCFSFAWFPGGDLCYLVCTCVTLPPLEQKACLHRCLKLTLAKHVSLLKKAQFPLLPQAPSIHYVTFKC